MSTKPFNKFWVAVTACITIGLLVYLFPLLLDKYGLGKAILLACLIPMAMALAYLRGYWIATLFEKKGKTAPQKRDADEELIKRVSDRL